MRRCPIPLFDRKRPSLRPDLPSGTAPRADAVQDARLRAPAKPARSVLDSGEHGATLAGTGRIRLLSALQTVGGPTTSSKSRVVHHSILAHLTSATGQSEPKGAAKYNRFRAGMAGRQTQNQCMMYRNSWQGSAKADPSPLALFGRPSFVDPN
jgi:hypothetical protein